MMINLKDNSERISISWSCSRHLLRRLFVYYLMLITWNYVYMRCSWPILWDGWRYCAGFLYLFWEKKYYLKINQNLRYYLYLSVRNAAINALQKNNMLSMEELSGIDMGIPEESIDEEEQEERNKLLLENYKNYLIRNYKWWELSLWK